VWLQVSQTMLKSGSAISANAQSLHGAASAENIRLHGQLSLNRSSDHITYPPALKQNQSSWVTSYNVFITY
jgi:hypothetical protein